MLTVTQNSGLVDLTTLAAAKASLGETTTANDTAISALITRASGLISDYCGRLFGPARYTQTFRFPAYYTTTRARDRLILARYPVITVDAEKPSGITSGVVIVQDGTTLASTEYEVDPANGLVSKLTGTALSYWAGTVVTVTYPAGYGMPTTLGTYTVTLPAVVTEVCLDLVALGMSSMGRDSAVQLELTEGAGRIAYFDRGATSLTLESEMKSRLARFRVLPS